MLRVNNSLSHCILPAFFLASRLTMVSLDNIYTISTLIFEELYFHELHKLMILILWSMILLQSISELAGVYL